jgi:anaerobic ribonucleoside-triphosphate reductase activating protein
LSTEEDEEKNMYMDITFSDYPSKDGLAVICYIHGCEHNCKNCHNINLQKIEEDEEIIRLDDIENYCIRNNTNKIVISGGDPLYNNNKNFTKFICRELGEKYNICIYTGYSIDDVDFNGFKFIKCGKYDIERKQESFKTDDFIQFASSNQKLYNYKKELISNRGRYEFNK